MKKLSDFVARLDLVLQDGAGKLADMARQAAVSQAIIGRYSKDAPRELVSDVAGPNPASNDIALPTADNGATTFEDGFSILRAIEYPLGQIPPSMVRDDDWMLYRAPDGLHIRFLATVLSPTDTARVTWTSRHKDDASTVPDGDFEAVCDLAAAVCFQMLAAQAVQTGDSTLSADVVNYRTKSQEYLALAKQALLRYEKHMGISDADGAGAGAGVAPAISLGEVTNQLGAGVDRLTHPRRSR